MAGSTPWLRVLLTLPRSRAGKVCRASKLQHIFHPYSTHCSKRFGFVGILSILPLSMYALPPPCCCARREINYVQANRQYTMHQTPRYPIMHDDASLRAVHPKANPRAATTKTYATLRRIQVAGIERTVQEPHMTVHSRSGRFLSLSFSFPFSPVISSGSRLLLRILFFSSLRSLRLLLRPRPPLSFLSFTGLLFC